MWGLSDAELARRCQAGDVEAFEPLLQRHQEMVLNLCFQLTGSTEEAQDAAQEAFVLVYETIGRLRKPEAFRAYLLRTAMRLCWRSALAS